MKDMIKLAKNIAKKAHEGQVDKSGKDYIYHPLTVASCMETDEEKIVALLHDVVEDSDITINDLVQYGFSDDVIKAVDVLTKKEGQPYDKYIEELKTNIIAIKVKIADLTHNSDLTRITNPKPIDIERTKKYLRVRKSLIEFLNQHK